MDRASVGALLATSLALLIAFVSIDNFGAQSPWAATFISIALPCLAGAFFLLDDVFPESRYASNLGLAGALATMGAILDIFDRMGFRYFLLAFFVAAIVGVLIYLDMRKWPPPDQID